MVRGFKVKGGDRLAKTILFAKNQAHADFIADRFNANYPHYKGEFARVITFKTEYAQSLIDAFSSKDKAPHIALSVDMLDTGIDVPEVANLVFFKVVRSKTKFWQMVGRGTRLCRDLYGPGKHKDSFFIFDYCQNLEFFSQNPDATEGSAGQSLGKRLFDTRLELIGEIDNETLAADSSLKLGPGKYDAPRTNEEVRQTTAHILQTEVASMNLENFVVRPKRRTVEKYAKPEAWSSLSPEARHELSEEIAGLPTELDPEGEEAKRFDLLLLNLQLARLRSEHSFERLRDQVRGIAGFLEDKSSIPMVRDQLPLIQDLQTDEWWQDVTVPMLENVRRKLRDLVKFIDKTGRHLVYTDFEDELGQERRIDLPGFGEGTDLARFRSKAQAFLRAHQDHVAIHRLRTNRPLTPTDLTELERILVENGVGPREEIQRAATESHGLGLLVRSLVGLDREAAKGALSTFTSRQTMTASQLEFVNLIVDHLTEHGVMEAARLYESPFTDLTPRGPEGLFTSGQVDELLRVLDAVRATAVAA